MVTGGWEVPDPAQSTWACQQVQEPENVGSGLTDGVETGAVGCEVVALGTGCDVVALGTGCDVVALGTGCDVVALGTGRDVVALGTGCDVVALGTGCDVVALGTGCDVVALGTRELITWSRERPSQVLLRTKSCSQFTFPIVTGTVWTTAPLTLAVIWYGPGLSAIWYPPVLQVCVEVVCPVRRFVASICTPPWPAPISYMPVCWLS